MQDDETTLSRPEHHISEQQEKVTAPHREVAVTQKL